jgi:hypothetical protein
MKKVVVILAGLIIMAGPLAIGADEQVKLFPIMSAGKFGYTNTRGRMTIKPEFDWAFDFSEGLALVNIGGSKNEMGYVIGGKWGYIEPKGRIVINPQFDDAKDFSQGLALVNIGGKVNELGLLSDGKRGYIDRQGKMVVEPQYDEPAVFPRDWPWSG